MSTFSNFFYIYFFLLSYLWAEADVHHHCRPDSHAPIGVMGGHRHNIGEWMLSYRFMAMSMKENFSGSNSLSIFQARNLGPGAGYMMVPTEMSMRMHMVGLMYAPTDGSTLIFMFQHIDQEMVTDMNGNLSKTFSRGPGDSSLSWLIGMKPSSYVDWHLGLGLQFPTGSIGVKDVTAMSGGEEVLLPYPMQLGSGTFNFEPSITLKSREMKSKISWGGQLKGRFHTGKNRQGYTLGDRFLANAWVAWMWSHHLSASLRLDYNTWGKIDGRDRDLAANAPDIMPTANPSLRGGERTDMSFGFNFLGRQHDSSSHRLAMEYRVAITQKLDGPQLGLDSSVVLGYQLAF